MLLFGVIGFGQKTQNKPTCFTDELIKSSIKDHPEIRERMENMDLEFSKLNKINSNKQTPNAPTITIPVVIYVVHDGQAIGVGSNISDIQVQSQITALNTYFNVYGINFCLATKWLSLTIAQASGPGGISTTQGIFHVNNASLSNHYGTPTGQNGLLGLTGNYVSGANLLRIWVVKSIEGINSGILGYSSFPFSNLPFDGIVMRSDAFGNGSDPICSSCTLLPGNNLGKVLAHEVGHYLGLYHTFENNGGICSGGTSGDCDTKGDKVCDTPPVANPNRICDPLINSCYETPDLPDDISNYMDYTDDNCRTHFTLGQKQRMFNILNSYRDNLYSTDNLINVGACNSATLLSATFTPSTYQACNTTVITFTPVTTVNATYSWNFGDGSTSTLQNPSHTYSIVNANDLPYTVSLTITRGTEVVFSSVQIFVTNCLPINNSETTWRHGVYQKINFASGVPVASLDPCPPLSYFEATACQSSINGSFLFHTDGLRLLNSNNQVIASDLIGSRYGSGGHGVIIVPMPGNSTKYYVFTKNSSISEQPIRTGFNYSIIDVNGTNVSIAQSNKNIAVTFPSSNNYIQTPNNSIEGGEGVEAVATCDGYWIITTGLKSTGYFVMFYKLNNSGLTFINEFPLNTNITSNLIKIEVAPNGNKLLITSSNRRLALPGGSSNFVNYIGESYLYDFDKKTASLSNPINMRNDGIYGASFSPNSHILYVTDRKKLYQYNLDSQNVLITKKDIFPLNDTGDIQRGPDNKLYFIYPNANSFRKIGVINKPNLIDTFGNNNCLVNRNGPFPSNNGNIFQDASGLPNMIDCKKTTGYDVNSISAYITGCNSYKFFPDVCGSSFNWNFGDPSSGANNISSLNNPSHIFSGSGTFTVTLTGQGITTPLTTQITISAISVPVVLGNSSTCFVNGTAITNNSVTLLDNQNAVWSIFGGSGVITGGNNGPTVNVTWSSLPGTLSLTVTNPAGCSATVTKTITVTPSISPSFSAINPICSGNTIVLPSTSINGITGTWSPVINNLATTTYTFYPSLGQCTNSTTLTVTVLPNITPTFNAVTAICSGSNISSLPTTSTNGITGTWSPAIVSNTNSGSYTFTPNIGQCATTKILLITVLPISDPSCTIIKPCLPDITLIAPETNNLPFVYKRLNWIQTNTNYITLANQNITMKAGEYIYLKEGTYINANYLGKIEVCASANKIANENIVEEIKTKDAILIYPNPTNYNITITSEKEKIKSININSIEGKTFFVLPQVNSEILDIDTSNFQTGIYIINIEMLNGEKIRKKLIKN